MPASLNSEKTEASPEKLVKAVIMEGMMIGRLVMEKNFGPIAPVLITALLVAGCQESNIDKLVPVTLAESKVSIVGDDTFVNRRFQKYTVNRFFEILSITGGHIFYEQMYPGYYLTDNNYPKERTIEYLNKYKQARLLDLRATTSDVRESHNQYAEYFYVAVKNDQGSCVAAQQFFGVTEQLGDQHVAVRVCWPVARGSAAKLETFLHDLMERVRFDDGAINEAKAASVKKKSTVERRLNEIERLLDEGTLSPQEARKKRQEILGLLPRTRGPAADEGSHPLGDASCGEARFQRNCAGQDHAHGRGLGF